MEHFWIYACPTYLTFYVALSCVIEHPLLLLISLDGLNHRFVTEKTMPNIWYLGQNGVIAANGVKTQVMTSTAPNHHCIATGLYTESHGIIDNYFYDPVLDDFYDIWNDTENSTMHDRSLLPQWYTGGDPIWKLNMQIEGRLSGSYLWPMGEADVPSSVTKQHKYKPWTDYHDYDEWKKEIDELVEWFTNDTHPINLGLYYNAQPDHAMHEHDLNGENVTNTLRQLDDLIGYLIERLKSVNLFHKMNFILTADHGHAEVKNESYTFTKICEHISPHRVINASSSFFPRPGTDTTEEDIFENFTRAIADGAHFHAWRKCDFPEKYRWKNNRRVGPVVVIPEIHYQSVNNKTFPHGTHGYLNDYEEMNAFFVAHGPAFKKGHIIENSDFIQNIDIYPLMCHILGIQPPPNNGSLERISIVLKETV